MKEMELGSGESIETEGEPLDEDIEDEKSYGHGWMSLFNFTDKRHTLALAAAVLFSVISGLVVPATAILLGNIFGSFTSFGGGQISSDEMMGEVTSYVLFLVVLGVASWFFSGAFFACWLMFGELQAEVAREKLFEGLVDKDMEWYDMRKSGVAGLISGVQT